MKNGTGKTCLQHMILGRRTFAVGKDIKQSDVEDFYYTCENINFNAHYQRYRFFRKNGKHFFFHETRDRPGDYGPATEKDRVASGTAELSGGDWDRFFSHIEGGTARKREEPRTCGDSGPWTFIYWDGDRSVYQEYSFPSYGKRKEFEEYCAELAEKNRRKMTWKIFRDLSFYIN